MSVKSITSFWLVNCSRIQQVRNSYTEALASTNPKAKFMCYLLSEKSTWISRNFYSFCISENIVYVRGSELWGWECNPFSFPLDTIYQVKIHYFALCFVYCDKVLLIPIQREVCSWFDSTCTPVDVVSGGENSVYSLEKQPSISLSRRCHLIGVFPQIICY